MTKSVKEKNRLSAIREHEKNGTPVTYDLLKVKMCYKANPFIAVKRAKDSKKYLKERHLKGVLKTIYNSKWIKNNFSYIFSDIFKNKIIDIANQLKLYEIVINPYLRTDFIYEKISMSLSVYDFDMRYIGSLAIEKDSPLDSNFGKIKISGYRYTIITIDKIKPIFDCINKPKNNYKLIFRNDSYTKNPNIKKTDYLLKIINSAEYLYRTYLNTLNLNFELSHIRYNIKDNISFTIFFMNEGKSLTVYEANEHTKIDLIKNLIKMELLDIELSEEDLVMENIEQIENLIKLQNY